MLELLKLGKFLRNNFYLLWEKQTSQLREAFGPTDDGMLRLQKGLPHLSVCVYRCGGGSSGIMRLGLPRQSEAMR
jgi:hypothetical protein